jgi:hypothetical protein
MYEIKEKDNKVIEEKDKFYNNLMYICYFLIFFFFRKEVKTNTKRLKEEFANIKVQRYQEYSNYCIFISSK